MSSLATDIEYSSRRNEADEIREMENFIKELKVFEITHLVTRLFYDSKCDTCFIETTSPHNGLIWHCAEEHLSQFDLDGIIGHGNGMDAMWDEYNEDDTVTEALADEALDAEALMEQVDEEPPSAAAPDTDRQQDEKAIRQRRIELGVEGEVALSEWFSANGLAYISICQNPEVFARVFQGTIKRPDFFLLFDSLGLIAIDAKNISPYQGESFSLPLDYELRRAITFERVFRLPLWYAFKGENKWYWISALKAIEVGQQRTNTKTGKPFISIALSHFVEIANGDDLSRLYGQRMPSYKKVYQQPAA